MSERSEVKVLKEEVAELRKQITDMAVAMAELAARPQTYYPVYVNPPVYPQPTYVPPYHYKWWSGTSAPVSISYTSSSSDGPSPSTDGMNSTN